MRHLLVTLDRDYKQAEVDRILFAIRMVRGVEAIDLPPPEQAPALRRLPAPAPVARVRREAPTPELLNDRVMLRVHEFAELTGTPAPSVYKYVKTKVIPSARVGKTIRIPASAIQALLERKR